MATREQIGEALRRAHEAGDTESATRLAQAYRDYQEPAPSQTEDAGNPILNALYGFAARGNQAVAAVNPFADQEKIAREQEWVKTHPGAGIGSTIADIAMTLPAGAGASIPARALLTGAIEGASRPGSLEDRTKEAALGAVGSAVGDEAGKALTFLVKPFKETADKATQKLIQKAKAIGMNLSAADVTGNKSLQYADSALDFIPASSGSQAAFKDAKREAWQNALFKQGNQDVAVIPSDEVLGQMKNRISTTYNDLASRNNILVDQDLKDALAQIGSARNIDRMDANKRAIVQSYLDEFGAPPVGSTMSGKGYQNTRSMLDKQAKAMRNSNPNEAESLLGIRSAMDAAMGRSVSPADKAAWNQANNDWMVMKNIESAIDPTTGQISANKLMSTLARRDPNRVIYGNGDQQLTDLAKIGKQFIAPKTADSGTAQRSMWNKILTGEGATGLGLLAYDPTTAAIAGLGMMGGNILLPKVAAKMMQTPDGYLAKGIFDLNKEAVPGLTREKIIKELIRNITVQAGEATR